MITDDGDRYALIAFLSPMSVVVILALSELVVKMYQRRNRDSSDKNQEALQASSNGPSF